MATYTATRAKHATLTAGTVDTVTLDKAYRRIRIINRSTADAIWYVVARGMTNEDNPAVAAGADGVDYLGPGAVVEVPDDQYLIPTNTNSTLPNTLVQMLSTGPAPYSISGLT